MLRRSLAALLAAVALTACGDGSTGPHGTIEGTYTLTTVNGKAPPYMYYQDDFETDELMAGTLTIHSGNTFSDVITTRYTVSGSVTTSSVTCTGTFTRTGDSITFEEATTNDCGGTFVGTWNRGNSMTVALDATAQAVFKK
ncbi:MAG: hypothetical protein ACJ79S_09890 [Gemmatimonadaceae bacterium]